MKFATALSISVLSLSSLDLFASAFVYPSTPVGATVWKPDSTVSISWSDDKQAPLLASKPVFDIFLMTGSDDHQTKLATIATNVKGGVTNSVKYVVPHVSPPGQIYFLMFQTKDGKDTAWATRFTITDEKGNHGTLHPTIPPGGKINPGGVGAIVPAPKKKGAPKAGAPAKAPPANAPANAPKPKPMLQSVPDKQTEKSAGEARERVANNPSLVHVDASSSDKVASAGVPAAAPWFSMVMGAVVAGTIVLSML
ncbi:hypothetical protein BG006_000061 [Podila minutissima]|uniref:Yeast cell wall synthesis Kre9/Knh1-like N-terminal domain-containing protein n=1 Tax=Podila minutissima TaxID=64525 RepID=A0A9P5VRA1_9FUNG|nr:hypothetical protein BG006_000061 [Podila minutissima]